VAILGEERQRPAWTARPFREKNAEGANAGRNAVAALEEDEEEMRQRVRPAASRRIAILVAAPDLQTGTGYEPSFEHFFVQVQKSFYQVDRF